LRGDGGDKGLKGDALLLRSSRVGDAVKHGGQASQAVLPEEGYGKRVGSQKNATNTF
jgi:hypothetical protein